MTTNKQTKWKAYRFVCFSLTDKTALTGKVAFDVPVAPEAARVRVGHELVESITTPGCPLTFDPENILIIIRPVTAK